MSRLKGMRGFSLIELMVAIALLSIAAGIAVPNLARMVRNGQLESQAQTLGSLLQFARSEAVIRRTPVTISAASNTWTVSTASETLRREEFTDAQVTISSTLSPISLAFTSSGSASAASFILCRDNESEFAYLLTVQPSGGIRLHQRGKDADDLTNLGDCTP
jgi:type IV fimbrial biogenesis protein FimU